MFGRAAITLGIGPHSSYLKFNSRVKKRDFYRRRELIEGQWHAPMRRTPRHVSVSITAQLTGP